MARNASKLYYPMAQAIASILPLVDEFVVALGASDPDDNTRQQILALNSPKIKIIDTVWDLEKYPRGMENAHQTDIAKSHCTGDWLFYLQADEVVHEKYLPLIKKRCQQLLNDPEVEGLLFAYKHFWGDYYHYHNSHSWYKHEIRIIRNKPDIHSWVSAQSFRRIPNFDGLNYRIKEGTYKLKVATVEAEIYHYGWVRPVDLMVKKYKALDTIHHGAKKVDDWQQQSERYAFSYGPLGQLQKFEDTHPTVMKKWIDKFDWATQLNYTTKANPKYPLHKHQKNKEKIISWLENKLFGGRKFSKNNWILLKR